MASRHSDITMPNRYTNHLTKLLTKIPVPYELLELLDEVLGHIFSKVHTAPYFVDAKPQKVVRSYATLLYDAFVLVDICEVKT
jgi:hypothetical protein